jgi:hypothetical protein
VLAKFSVTGSECALAKSNVQVSGELNAILPNAETAQVTHLYEFNPATEGSQQLTMYGNEATFTSREELALSGADKGIAFGVKTPLGVVGLTNFVGGLTEREITLFVPASGKEVTFTNGANGKPGEAKSANGNFTVLEVVANKCGAKLAAGKACAVRIKSAQKKESGTYVVTYTVGGMAQNPGALPLIEP